MERYIRTLLLVIVMMFSIIPVAKAQVPFDFHAPWMADTTATAGSTDPNGASYYNGSSSHDGYDQYCIDFNIGSGWEDYRLPVLAIADGIVTAEGSESGEYVYYDYDVRIDHGDGYSSIYVHMDANVVGLYEEVKQGQTIGYIGTLGKSTAPHLHFCIYGSDGRTVMPSPMDGFELAENDAGTDVMSANDIRFLDRLTTELQETNPYSNSYIFLGVADGDIHWWNGTTYGTDDWDPYDPVDSIDPASNDYYAETVYVEDYTTGWCDGAIVYDALGGARSAYVIQCQQWDAWISQDVPTIGPESFLGNPVTNVYQVGGGYYQLFQGGYIRLKSSGQVITSSYAYGYAPGHMDDGSWNPQLSYRFAQEYEQRGAHKRWGFPNAGVVSLDNTGTYYAQYFPRKQKAIVLNLGTQTFTVTSQTTYDSLVSGGSSIASLASVSDTSSTDTLDQDQDGYTPDDGDCNDLSNGVHPDHAELQDKVDNDCDGEIDNDMDSDGYTIAQGDCNDLSNGQYPNHPELNDDRDNDCDALVDDQGIELTSLVAADLSDLLAHPSCGATSTLTTVVFSTEGGRIQQFTYNGNTWSSLDLSAQAPVPYASPGTSPSIFTHPTTGERFVIFTGQDRRIQLLRSTTGTWTSLDLTAQAAVDFADPDSSPSGLISPNTQYLYVVFSTEGGRIQQFTYNGNTWSSLDLSAQAPVPFASPGTSPHLFLHPYSGERFVVFTGDDRRIQLLRSTTGTWTSLDLTSQAAVDFADPDSSPFGYIDPFTEYLHVVFTTEAGRIQQFTYDGTSWTSLDLSSQAAVPLAAPGSSPTAFVDSWTEERIVQFLGEDNRLQELTYDGISWTSQDLTSLIPIAYSAASATPAVCFNAYTGDRSTVFTGGNARVELVTYQGE